MSRTAKCFAGNGWGIYMMITDAKAFGKAVRNRRKKLGYTQAYVARESGFSVSFISDLENGKGTAELERSIRLAGFLGLGCRLTDKGE